MSRKGGDSYYVLVNNQGEEYTVDDIVEGEIIVDYDTEEDAEEALSYLIEDGELEEADGWHVERHRW